jgi:DNA primase
MPLPVEDVKAQVSLVDVVNAAVRLQQSGRYLKGLCPFHEEETPSFFVFPERGTWRCFGCGRGGDVISFVMERERASFVEAVESLAREAGITLSRQEERQRSRNQSLAQINLEAAQFYHRLLKESPEAARARDYLAERGIEQETIARFMLGYAPNRYGTVRKHLVQLGFSPEDLTAVGLLTEGDREPYERFRGRIMFPIRDARGRFCGFGARTLSAEIQPKYMNTPQTPLFDKSGLLYGLDLAHQSIRERKQCIIVEGYTDVMMAHQHGETNVVASMGTALTEKHVQSVKRLTTNLVLALDPDAAGSAATLRGLEVARRAFDRVDSRVTVGAMVEFERTLEAEISIAVLPAEKDPDQLLRENIEAWHSCINAAEPFMDYSFRLIAQQFGRSSIQAKRDALQELAVPIITEVRDPVARQQYLKRLSEALDLGIQSEVLTNLIHSGLRTRRASAQRRQVRQDQTANNGQEQTEDRLDQYLLGLLIMHPEAHSLASEVIDAEDFRHPLHRQAFEYLEAAQSNRSNSLELSAQESVLDLLGRLQEERGAEPSIDEEYLRPTVVAAALRLKRRNVQEEYEDLQLLLATEHADENRSLGSQIRHEMLRISEQLRQVNQALQQTSFIRTS